MLVVFQCPVTKSKGFESSSSRTSHRSSLRALYGRKKAVADVKNVVKSVTSSCCRRCRNAFDNNLPMIPKLNTLYSVNFD